jgi:hypothetical protein
VLLLWDRRAGSLTMPAASRQRRRLHPMSAEASLVKSRTMNWVTDGRTKGTRPWWTTFCLRSGEQQSSDLPRNGEPGSGLQRLTV